MKMLLILKLIGLKVILSVRCLSPQKGYFCWGSCIIWTMFYFTQQATFEISRQARNDTNNVIRCIYFVIPSVVEGSPIKLVEKDKNYNLIFISKVKKLFLSIGAIY